MAKANRFVKNDEGVSAVIGVILMVAITVILAAVIAAFVFGMVGGVKKTYTVSVTVARAPNGDILINNMGGNDAGLILNGSNNGFTIAYTASSGNVVTEATDLAVGASYKISSTSAAPQCHVVVTGNFKDGTQQVLATADV
ncbi:putative archaeal flagellin [Methanocella conradii HZ254]|uniref:Archaeal flagellin n=1 Tax=Methanocella conradii (strain DSM 24694 / JCM 17849 / CGMCC 1.5162 / HZ254) TaxID=1041930 RepID=H8I627_METCZ|nr:type IV pilin N-terminal domain-containing protein [Methanocella conradii]AFD00261.1 putative archaeal flagellin [Methanocella conradii HZ254]